MIVIINLLVISCSSHTHYANYKTDNLEDFKSQFKNTETKIRSELTVTTAVLTDEECTRLFGVPLVSKGVEPVWIEIKNDDEIPYAFFPIDVDPFYFSPSEAARKAGLPIDFRNNHEEKNLFEQYAIHSLIEPGETASGFVYTVPDIGVKEFKIHMVGPKNQKHVYFVFPLPGITLDIKNLQIDQYRNPIILVDTDGELLYEKLSEFPCCASNQEGDKIGDPLNLIIIGHLEDFLPYFISRGWEVTEDIYVSSMFKELKAFFFGKSYKNAPISPLYHNDKRHDIALQKPRSNIYARNHFRLWLTDLSYKREPIWIGQISRDIGVSFTTKNWWLSTHDIDPDIDEARNFFVQDMLTSNGVKRFGYIKGMDPKTQQEPLFNFMEQPMYTDGLRAVFIFDADHTPLSDLELFNWEWPAEYQLKGVVKWEDGEKDDEIEINDSPVR